MTHNELSPEMVAEMKKTLEKFKQLQASGYTLDGEDYLRIGHLCAALNATRDYTAEVAA